MPQLNPTPWLLTFLFSWTIVIALLPLKVAKYITPNLPSQKSTAKPHTSSWLWPWR
uniref:ATP synthase complex subunit 8 n=1 Tax=Pempheris schwenkii TaxID=463600 RepID=A0A0B6VR23_9TELE|nr:ATPase subunit 8 [Pempheris schwenkii]BAQ20946.1 ATPase subunit 8 [Pempheris schwenkii]